MTSARPFESNALNNVGQLFPPGFALFLRGNTRKLVIGIAVPLVLHLVEIKLHECLIQPAIDLGMIGGWLGRRTRRGDVVFCHGLADLQFPIARHGCDMGQGDPLRIPFQTTKLHLLLPHSEREAEIAEFLLGGKGCGFWGTVSDARHSLYPYISAGESAHSPSRGLPIECFGRLGPPAGSALTMETEEKKCFTQVMILRRWLLI